MKLHQAHSSYETELVPSSKVRAEGDRARCVSLAIGRYKATISEITANSESRVEACAGKWWSDQIGIVGSVAID